MKKNISLDEKLEKILNKQEINMGKRIIKALLNNPEIGQRGYRGSFHSTISNRVLGEDTKTSEEFERVLILLKTSGVIQTHKKRYKLNSEYTRNYGNQQFIN